LLRNLLLKNDILVVVHPVYLTSLILRQIKLFYYPRSTMDTWKESDNWVLTSAL